MTIDACPDKSTFQKKVTPIYAEYRDKIGGDVIDAFTKQASSFRECGLKGRGEADSGKRAARWCWPPGSTRRTRET